MSHKKRQFGELSDYRDNHPGYQTEKLSPQLIKNFWIENFYVRKKGRGYVNMCLNIERSRFYYQFTELFDYRDANVRIQINFFSFANHPITIKLSIEILAARTSPLLTDEHMFDYRVSSNIELFYWVFPIPRLRKNISLITWWVKMNNFFWNVFNSENPDAGNDLEIVSIR